MAGHAASRTVPFGSVSEPRSLTGHLIQIKASLTGAANDPAFVLRQSSSPTAQEDKQS